MNTTIANVQRCVLLKNGIQLWLDEDKALQFLKDWQSMNEPKVLLVNGEAFSSTEIAGVYTSGAMDEYTRRKNGQWKCRVGSFHDRGEKCVCKDPTSERDWETYRQKFYQAHGYYPLRTPQVI